jgi:hypothetical protein
MANKKEQRPTKDCRFDKTTILIMPDQIQVSGFVLCPETLHLRIWANGKFQIEGKIEHINNG